MLLLEEIYIYIYREREREKERGKEMGSTKSNMLRLVVVCMVLVAVVAGVEVLAKKHNGGKHKKNVKNEKAGEEVDWRTKAEQHRRKAEQAYENMSTKDRRKVRQVISDQQIGHGAWRRMDILHKHTLEEHQTPLTKYFKKLFNCKTHSKLGEPGCIMMDVFIYTLVWSALFVGLRCFTFADQSYTFSNRVVSIIHAVLSFYLCSNCMFFEKLHDSEDFVWFKNFGGRTSQREMTVLSISMGYFIYDLFGCIIEEGIELEDLKRAGAEHLHHLATIAGLYVGVFMGVSGPELVMCLWSMEITNPMLHGRTLMKELKITNKLITSANEASFAVLFFIFRIIIGPIIMLNVLFRKRVLLVVKLGGLAIQLISCFWFYKIVQIAIKRSGKSAKSA